MRALCDTRFTRCIFLLNIQCHDRYKNGHIPPTMTFIHSLDQTELHLNSSDVLLLDYFNKERVYRDLCANATQTRVLAC